MAALDLADVALSFPDPRGQHALMEPNTFSGLSNNTGDNPPFIRISWRSRQQLLRRWSGLRVEGLGTLLFGEVQDYAVV